MRKTVLFVALWLLTILGFSQVVDTLAIDKIVWNSEYNKPSDPGLALGIFKKGKIIYSRGYGMANREDDVTINAQSVFDIASVSKQFTAACIIILALRDSLSLDDKLSKFFSAFPDYADKITLRHLLHHTSGLRDISSIALLKGYTNRDTYTDAEVMDWLTHQQGIDSVPGSEYIYCSSGYWLLGQIVNKVSRKNLADFAKQELFDPLGMTQTHFHNDHSVDVKNLARGYSPGDDEKEFQIRESDTELIGMGGVYTSIMDIKKWDDVFYDSNRFGKDFLKLMQQPGVLNDGKELDYASGLFLINYKGLRVIGHNGTSGSEAGYRAQVIRFTDQHFSIAIFANRSDIAPWAMTGRISDLFLKEQFALAYASIKKTENKYVILSSKEQEKFVGNYWNQRSSSSTEISIRRDTLWYKNEYVGEYALMPVSVNEFHKVNTPNSKITFGMTELGVRQMIEVVDEKRIDISHYYKPKTYSGKELNRFCGNYYSKELETTYQLKMKEDHLCLFIRGKEYNRLDAKQETIFDSGDNGVFYFRENKKGKIIGFRLAYFSVRVDFEKVH